MSRLLVFPQQRPLTGSISVPGDKSISHRAVMLGAIADGTSHIQGWLPAGDTLATLEAMRALGVSIRHIERSEQAWELAIAGRGLRGLQPPSGALDCRNAGTCMRLLAGLLAGQSFPTTLDGSEQLRRRPMRRIVAPLQMMGAEISATNDHAPLHIVPADVHGIDYEMPVASAQVKSAVLLAGLYARGKTRVRQPGPARDHTERMLAAAGVEVTVSGDWIGLVPPAENGPALSPLEMTVPGDFSSAAFPLVAATILPHSKIEIAGVGLNGTRTGLLDLLSAMGAQATVVERSESGGEPVGRLRVGFSELHAVKAGGSLVVRAIDEFPVWAVVASQAAGTSVLRDARELRVKEVDRISVLAEELRRLGTSIIEQEDGFQVQGPVRLRGGEVDSHGDHRLGMALAIAGLVAKEPVIIQDAGCIADSFPGFVETMRRLGAEMRWE
jgi:3-phosphoshikimate 1-carboxyvinyltransferase